MVSADTRLLESTSRSLAQEYRINDGRVEARVLSDGFEPEPTWWQLSPAQLSSHVKRNTEVARWLERSLGWQKLLWACVGEEPTGHSDDKAA